MKIQSLRFGFAAMLRFSGARAVATGLGLCLLFSSSGLQAANFDGNHFEVYVDTVAATFTLGNPPQPGEQAIFSREVYELDLSNPENPVPIGPVIGTNIVICTLAGPAGLLCQGSVTLFGYGTITLSGVFAFQNPTDVAVTGGTGRFAGARGEMTALEVNPDADQVYWFDLSGARR